MSATATLIFVTLGLGISVAVIAYSVFTLVSEVPTEDRTFYDRPPALMRLVWSPVQFAAHYLGPRLSLEYREATMRKLRKAELDFAVSPQQWFAGKLVYTVVLGGMLAFFALAVDQGVWTWAIAGAAFGFFYPDLWLRDEIKRKETSTLKELPTYLDVLTLAIEGGCSLTMAINIATEKAADSPLRRAFQRFLREVRSGKPRSDALKSMEERMDMAALTSLTSALFQAEKTGASLGAVLRAQATQRTNERFARAEKLAMEAPVKMLGPLILCIFPCTFIVIGFPIVMKIMSDL
jgi:tight adherence protein C